MGREEETKNRSDETLDRSFADFEPSSADTSNAFDDETHLGRWLVKHLAGLGEIELPPRNGGRPSPFADWTEEDFADQATIAERLAMPLAPRR